MRLWRDLILRYHTNMKVKTLIVHDCPLWKNDDIGRELSKEGVASVMKEFVKRYADLFLLQLAS